MLLIGTDKASLYTRALVADIVHKQRHLAEPGWLLRVGVYLELLTCLGIADAVRADVGDLLTPQERSAFESERFAPIRSRVDADAWRAVWELREIAFPKQSVARAGPVSLLNLLRKKRATLEFLHVHHEDLKQAIELAGPNRFNAQETWQRVFRDAERAVLRQTSVAFPELGYLPRPARDFVLWHRRARLDSMPTLRVPKVVAKLMLDQDGLFAAACNQYRASMNAVAEWAKERSLMDPAGNECIPQQVSLLEAYMEHPERIPALQRRDGYGTAPRRDRRRRRRAASRWRTPSSYCARCPCSGCSMRTSWAHSRGPLGRWHSGRWSGSRSRGRRARPSSSSPTARSRSSSAAPQGPDLKVATLGRGEVIGEMSLLTGEPRAATVRAVDGALVYEIGQPQYAPLLHTHREWVEELAMIMEERLRQMEADLDVVRRAEATTRYRPSHRPAFLLDGRRRALRSRSGRLSRSLACRRARLGTRRRSGAGLPEQDVGAVAAPVVEAEDQPAADVPPVGARLPLVVVQAARELLEHPLGRAERHRVAERLARHAVDRLHPRVARPRRCRGPARRRA